MLPRPFPVTEMVASVVQAGSLVGIDFTIRPEVVSLEQIIHPPNAHLWGSCR
jgi:hypothetical protein